MRRTAVYFDGGPFTDAIRGQGMSMDMDFMALLRATAPDLDLVAGHFFIAEYPEIPYPAKHRNEKKRLAAIAAQGITVHLSKTQIVGSIFIDRGVEAMMTAQLIVDAYSDAFDLALIISRRPELVSGITAVKNIGKSVELAYFNFQLDPTNPLESAVERVRAITIEDAVAQRKSGPRPPFSA